MITPIEKNERHEDVKFPFSIYELKNGFELAPHYHDDFEILYVESGKLQIAIGSDEYIGKAGSIFFSNMYQIHSCEYLEDTNIKLYAIVFDKEILDMININSYYIDYIKPFLDGTKRFPKKLEPGSELYEDICSSIKLIITEYSKKELAYEIFIATAIERLFASMIRYNEVLQDTKVKDLSRPNKVMLDEMIRYIDNNYQGRITLSDISSHLNLNRCYFCRLVKTLTGKPFSQFLNMYRVRQAEVLLSSTQLHIYEIAENIGFLNMSYFNRIFLKYTGSTPSEFRQSKYSP